MQVVVLVRAISDLGSWNQNQITLYEWIEFEIYSDSFTIWIFSIPETIRIEEAKS